MTAAKQGYRRSKEQQCGDEARGTREGDGRTGLYARTSLTVMHVSVSSLMDARKKIVRRQSEISDVSELW